MEVDMLNQSYAKPSALDYQSNTKIVADTPSADVKPIEVKSVADHKNEKTENNKDSKDSKLDQLFDTLTNNHEPDTTTRKFLDKAVDEANKKLVGYNRRLEYNVHKKTNQIMVKIIDSNSGEVVKEIPPEKTLDAVAKMWELAGIIIDERR